MVKKCPKRCDNRKFRLLAVIVIVIIKCTPRYRKEKFKNALWWLLFITLEECIRNEDEINRNYSKKTRKIKWTNVCILRYLSAALMEPPSTPSASYPVYLWPSWYRPVYTRWGLSLVAYIAYNVGAITTWILSVGWRVRWGTDGNLSEIIVSAFHSFTSGCCHSGSWCCGYSSCPRSFCSARSFYYRFRKFFRAKRTGLIAV